MTTTMNAAVCYEFGKPLVIEEIRIDQPRSEEVMVRLTACAICHSDILYIDGAWGGVLPSVYGHEAAGIVEQIGDQVEHVRKGDTVIISLLRSCKNCYFCKKNQHNLCNFNYSTDEPNRMQTIGGKSIHRGLGTACFAEFAIVHKSQVVNVPSEMSPSVTSLLSCGVITGYGSVVHTAEVKKGSHVVVVGAGGVGINCIQAANLRNSASITVIDINNERLNAARKFGATHVVNPTVHNPVELILKLTDQRGADAVFVATGNPQAFKAENFQLLRRGGKLVLVGMPPVGFDLNFEAVDFIDANQSILGSKMGDCNLHTDIPKLLELYRKGMLELDSLVSAQYSFENINLALNSTRNGIGIRNVVVF